MIRAGELGEARSGTSFDREFDLSRGEFEPFGL